MEKNRRAVITGVRQVSIIDSPMPSPKEDWVLVKVHSSPLCTEYKHWEKGEPFPGHEAAGEVVGTSGCSARVKVGDRVVVMPSWACGKCELCRSGEYIHCQNWYDYQAFTGLDTGADTHVQYLMKQDWLLCPIPDDVSYDRAAMACCGLGPTFGAAERFGINAFDVVLVVGAGPVGLGGVINARYRGATVLAVDTVPYRLQLARSLGADYAFNPADGDVGQAILEATQGRGVTCVLETSGTMAGFGTGLEAVRPLGKIAVIGEAPEIRVQGVFRNIIQKGVTLVGQWHYNLGGMDKMMEMIRTTPAVEKMITHRFPLEQMGEALKVCAQKDCGKVVLHPWE